MSSEKRTPDRQAKTRRNQKYESSRRRKLFSRKTIFFTAADFGRKRRTPLKERILTTLISGGVLRYFSPFWLLTEIIVLSRFAPVGRKNNILYLESRLFVEVCERALSSIWNVVERGDLCKTPIILYWCFFGKKTLMVVRENVFVFFFLVTNSVKKSSGNRKKNFFITNILIFFVVWNFDLHIFSFSAQKPFWFFEQDSSQFYPTSTSSHKEKNGKGKTFLRSYTMVEINSQIALATQLCDSIGHLVAAYAIYKYWRRYLDRKKSGSYQRST